MRILLVDRTLTGQPHANWKEGWELLYAFENLGHTAAIAGPGCPFPPKDILLLAPGFDLIIATENYPDKDWAGFDWWNDWKYVKTPKVFWAIDTHLTDCGIAHNYVDLTQRGNFDWVACNNPKDTSKFKNSFWLPYAASRKHHGVDLETERIDPIILAGSLTPDREPYVNRYRMKHVVAYGPDYVRAMQSAKICFNKTKSYDINAKYFEILGCGAFMLANWNDDLRALINLPELDEMLWKNDADLDAKIEFYLRHFVEREFIASKVRHHILTNHAWENRAELILKCCGYAGGATDGWGDPAPPATGGKTIEASRRP